MEVGTIKQVDIQQEMQVAYLDYAMSVIVARALPDVRDGLKPVHRRILYAMYDMGLSSDKPYKKSARIVGEVLGKYHPHGDAAVYDAMVRMAQDFSLRYVLVDGQGNFGSIDGDNPAAMRYTEARLHALAQEMLADIDKSTIDFTANFDDTLKEPSVLPAALPNLLVNGASGIAVGMATNIPPHNLAEVCDALAFVIDRYDQIDDITVEQLMRFIKGPDFPTGGILYRYDRESGPEREDVIARAYASGRGHFRVQAQAHIEEMSRNRSRIVVSELPYQVNKTNLIERIAEIAREGRIEGISDLRDESDRSGMRIVIELTRTADPRAVLADLYKYTPMQQTFGMTMLALVDGEPRLLSLKRVLQLYVEHRREIIRRRSEFDLARARERAHILQGLLKALDNLDEVIQTIRRSETSDTARANLIHKFKFTEIQAQAILDMPLKRLAALERKRLREEYEGLLRRIADLEDLLAHPAKILGVIKEELAALKERYTDARRTRIAETGVSSQSLTVHDLLEDEPVMISLGRNGALLREGASDRRRGKLPSKLDDRPPLALAAGSSRNEVCLFSANGRVGHLPVHRLPADSEVQPADLGLLERGDRPAALLVLSRPDSDQGQGGAHYLVLATREGRVKRVALEDVWSAVGVVTAMNIDEGDELIGVARSDGSADVLLVTKLGQAIRFPESEVRPMGLPAAGVWGIKLSSGDEVVSLGLTRPGGEVLLATTAGYFKRTQLEEFPMQRRHGNGVAALRLGQTSGAVAAAHVILPGDEFFSASARGTLRRLDYQEIPAGKRSAQGKLIVQPAQGDRIAAVLHLPVGRPRSGPSAVASTRKRSPAPHTESRRRSVSMEESQSALPAEAGAAEAEEIEQAAGVQASLFADTSAGEGTPETSEALAASMASRVSQPIAVDLTASKATAGRARPTKKATSGRSTGKKSAAEAAKPAASARPRRTRTDADADKPATSARPRKTRTDADADKPAASARPRRTRTDADADKPAASARPRKDADADKPATSARPRKTRKDAGADKPAASARPRKTRKDADADKPATSRPRRPKAAAEEKPVARKPAAKRKPAAAKRKTRRADEEITVQEVIEAVRDLIGDLK